MVPHIPTATYLRMISDEERDPTAAGSRESMESIRERFVSQRSRPAYEDLHRSGFTSDQILQIFEDREARHVRAQAGIPNLSSVEKAAARRRFINQRDEPEWDAAFLAGLGHADWVTIKRKRAEKADRAPSTPAPAPKPTPAPKRKLTGPEKFKALQQVYGKGPK